MSFLNKNNWDKLKNKDYTSTVKGRDVYNSQQFDRGKLQEPGTMTWRNIVALCITAISVLLTWALICLWNSMQIHSIDDFYPKLMEFFLGQTEIVFSISDISYLQISFIAMIGACVWVAMYQVLKKNLDAQNMLSKTEDINQFENDQHIALPEEVQRRYNWFPDVGAHSDVQVSSLISHMAIKNKGIKKIDVARRYEEDVLDEDGNILFFKGDYQRDENENIIFDKMPLFDEKFANEIFDVGEVPQDVRKFYDVRTIEYNPNGTNPDKLGFGVKHTNSIAKASNKIQKKQYDKYLSRKKNDVHNSKEFDEDKDNIPNKPKNIETEYPTVASLINNDWDFPEYETQRPAGAYIVDSAPVNTMVLAITRGGKGQKVIEPTIDMWTRERRINNIVITDPKGELLRKFYVRGAYRGFSPVQINLINPMKTDIYNPIGMAVLAAREGDYTRCSAYIDNISEIFFPPDSNEDPVWPQAAGNAFKRAAFGMIEYYLEEERDYKRKCELEAEAGRPVPQKVIETYLDQLWGHVTLYNCYQMFAVLTAKKCISPANIFAEEYEAGKYKDLSDEELNELAAKANREAELWEGQAEVDALTLYFNASNFLPKNSMRQIVADTNNSLKAMGIADKFLASVYGIALNSMYFFTNPTISTLTSGTPSQTIDLASFSFPRRIGIKFHPDYVKHNHYVGLQCVWEAYEDKNFSKKLDDKLFGHEDTITRDGWAKYYFDGKFKNDISYIKLIVQDESTKVKVKEYYFEFQKSYLTSLDGRIYMKDPILDTKIVRDGFITEMIKTDKGFKYGHVTFDRKTLKIRNNADEKYTVETENIPVITQQYAKYAEKPKMMFLVSPPHLQSYSKLILILIKQLTDLNFDQSYMTKSNQKPLYKTRYMLDELGNIQADGHGILDFETLLSIGLGQDQQFTLILQTLQQLRSVYGEDVDKIVQGNTSNIIFLKSEESDMLKELETMSGITHVSMINQKTVTRDMEKIAFANEGKASYMMETKEVPVITTNDLKSLPENNAIVFKAGESPIWNRNETIMPVSRKLHENTITVPGVSDYTLQTIPTLSTAMDFDLKKNQPDFLAMLEKRKKQALYSSECITAYNKAFGYNETDIQRLDKDVYANDVMNLIDSKIRTEDKTSDTVITDNTSVINEVSSVAKNEAAKNELKYADKTISIADLVSGNKVSHLLDEDFIYVYREIRGDMDRDPLFSCINGSLYSSDGNILYLEKIDSSEVMKLAEASREKDTNVYMDFNLSKEDAETFAGYRVTDDFVKLLASLPSWDMIAKGRFEQLMAQRMAS